MRLERDDPAFDPQNKDHTISLYFMGRELGYYKGIWSFEGESDTMKFWEFVPNDQFEEALGVSICRGLDLIVDIWEGTFEGKKNDKSYWVRDIPETLAKMVSGLKGD